MLPSRILGSALLCTAAFLACAQQGGDLQAQILYAYQTEEVNQLASIVQTLATQVQAGNADDALRYHLAHAEYRLGLLRAGARQRGADGAFDDCVVQLKAILKQHADSAEALLLESACYANLASLEHLQSVLLRERAADRLDAAFKIAPRNPRVVYLRARDALERSRPNSAQYVRAAAELQQAAQLFDQASGTSPEVPGWGHADAYLDYGRLLQAQGNFLDARNWIEKALIVAPDFKAAQRQLATLRPP